MPVWMLQALWGPGCILHTITNSAAVVNGLSCRRCLGKETQDYRVPTKTRFPPEIRAGNLCPLGHCLYNSWSGSLWRGPTALLASASGEPTGAVRAASHPPLLPQPASRWLFSELTMHKGWSVLRHVAQESAPGCLRGFGAGRSRINLYLLSGPKQEGCFH